MMLVQLDNIPAELKAHNQWVAWRYEQRDGKRTKVPITPGSTPPYRASVTNSQTWTSFAVAATYAERMPDGSLDGLGFVLTSEDDIVCVDLDKCRDPETGIIADEQRHILDTLNSYTEVSPSGTGVHCWMRATIPGKRNRKGSFEVYSDKRFICITGDRLDEYPATIERRQDELGKVYGSIFPDTRTSPKPTSKPTPATELMRDDAAVVAWIERHDKAEPLWRGDFNGHASQSEADLALCNHLAWRCGPDGTDQVVRLFLQSALGQREKAQRGDYVSRTVHRAYENRTEFWVPTTADEWPKPIPFGVYDLPAFPLEAFPERLRPLRQFCHDVAESLQVPADAVAMLSLAVGGAALAKRIEVRPKEDWLEPNVNLFVAVAMPSGERKSALFRAVIAPLVDFEREENERLAPLVVKNQNERLLLEAALKQARADAVSAKKKADDRLAARLAVDELAEQLRTTEVLRELQLVADDATPEVVSRLLDEQGGRVALLSPEGDVFDLMGGRYSDGVSRLGVYLKGHAGDDIRVNRVGRPSEFVNEPALTVGLAVQPEVLQGLLERPQLRGRGLLARFLYSLPTSLVGHRKLDPDPIPMRVSDAYSRLVREVLQLQPATDAKGEASPHAVGVSADAYRELNRLRERVERELRPNGVLGDLCDWGSKLPGAICRIAGILHGLMHPTDPAATSIDVETMLGAMAIGEYLIDHAKAAFALMGADPATALAKRLLSWIAEAGLVTFTKRDAHRSVRVNRVSELDDPLALLIERGYVRERPTGDRRGPGRAPSPQFDVNPIWLGQNGHNGQNSPAEPIVSNLSILSGGGRQ